MCYLDCDVNILMLDDILNLVYQLLRSMCNETRGVQIHVQAFINRHGQKHRQGRTNDTQEYWGQGRRVLK